MAWSVFALPRLENGA